MIAKAAASFDVLSEGRFELGIGAGGFWEAIVAMGGPNRSPRESLEALEEAIHLIRAFWAGGTFSFEGTYYTAHRLHPGPAPAHAIEVWVGGYKPRMLDMIGRIADGWVPSLPYAPPDVVPAMMERVDAGVGAAGRDPADLRRIYNLMGEITTGERGDGLVGPTQVWAEALTGFVGLGFDSFVFWPGGDDPVGQVDRFARDVAPAVRERVAAARG
jgi:alkanesulfonate monooxygenase SsuD/methylene tetrahydromethanopterin reductase-like flavin-dependent oxidoreductase (luciferase family)